MKIVCIGDSLTYGFAVVRKHTWVEMIRVEMNINVINRGVNGDTTAGMLARSYEDIISNYPDKVIIMGGTNDFIAGYSYNRVKENIIELLKEAKEHQIEAILGIQIPTYPGMAIKRWAEGVDYEKINENIHRYREEMIDYCDENEYNYIDFYGEFIKCTEQEVLDKYYTDGLHPTFMGHKIMYKSASKLLSHS